MQQVSFKLAKTLKDVGYPQDIEFWKYLEDNTCWYDQDGMLEKKGNMPEYIDVSKLIFAPKIMEVWLWLWEKGICIEIKNNHYYTLAKVENQRFHGNTPEEAISAAIEYLCENNLLK